MDQAVGFSYRAMKHDDDPANLIVDFIENKVAHKLNRYLPRNEVISWENSLRFMLSVLLDEAIPA